MFDKCSAVAYIGRSLVSSFFGYLGLLLPFFELQVFHLLLLCCNGRPEILPFRPFRESADAVVQLVISDNVNSLILGILAGQSWRNLFLPLVG